MSNVHSFDGSHKVAKVIATAAQGSQNSSWLSPFATSGVSGDADRAVFWLDIGTVTDDVDVAIFQATDTSGTGAKAITGAALTTITVANDNKIATIELRPDNMDDKNSFKYVQVQVTVASGTPIYSVAQILHRLRYPGIGGQVTTYDEQVEILA